MAIKVKPKDGLKVPHPDSGNPIRDGQSVARTPAIIRLLKSGDLVEIVETKSEKAKEQEK